MSVREPRVTPKALLLLHPEELVEGAPQYAYVTGKRGMVNLPGGGKRKGELLAEALERELAEELGITFDSVTDLKRARNLDVTSSVRTAAGELKVAQWQLFTGQLAVHSSELYMPEGTEITSIITGSPESVIEHQHTSLLAKGALMLAHPELSELHPQPQLRAV